MNQYLDAALDMVWQVIGYLKGTFSSIPLIVAILLFLGILVIIFAVIMVALSLRKPKPSKDKKVKSTILERVYSLPPLGGIVSEYLTRKGVFKVNEISLSFLKVMDFLRTHIGNNYKYRLPWFMVLGTAGSGKTTLLSSLDLQQPNVTKDLYDGNADPLCRWNFFSQAVVMDVKGSMFFDPNKIDEDNWRNLLILLSRYRSARPLDGIVLTISATDLYGKTALSLEETNSRADFIAKKINLSQLSLRMRLPIYILITKMDIVPGFQNICGEIPSHNRHNLMGWSSPYTPAYAYTPQWIEEAFSTINEQLEKLKIEILANSEQQSLKDGIFVFPHEAGKIKSTIATYLNKIFQTDSYHENPILRGIYFCGDCGMTQLKHLFDPVENEDNFAIISNNDTPLLEMEEVNNNDRSKVFFLNDLFSLKVFLEGGLAKPLAAKLLTLNRGLNILKVFLASFILLSTYGLFNAYDKFVKNRELVVPVLYKMSGLLRDIQSLRIDEPGHAAPLFDAYAKHLLTMTEQLQEISFFSWLVPASWFSPLHKDLNQGLKISYQIVIIRTIYMDLLLKARELLHLRPTVDDQSKSILQLLNPLSSPEYLLLKKYIDELTILSEKIYKFNNLKSASGPSDLEDLVQYTFDTELPKNFIDKYSKFRKLLVDMPFPEIELKPYQQLARNTLSVIYLNFLNALFSPNYLGSLSSRLTQLLHQIQMKDQGQIPNVKNLRDLSIDLATSAPKLGELGKTWMDEKFFNLGKDFDQTLDKIDDSKLFGTDVTQYLVDQTAIAFNRFKEQLRAFNIVLAVNNVNNIPNGPLSVKTDSLPNAYGIFTLEKSLSVLFAEPYMQESYNQQLITNVPANKIIYWDKNLIQAAYDMVKKYEEYIAKQLGQVPLSLQGSFKLLARQGLQESIINIISKAQTLVDLPRNMASGEAAEDILRSKVNDLQDNTHNFIKLLEILKQSGAGFILVELRKLLNNNGFWLLTEIEKMLQAFAPYSIRNHDFSWWDGKKGAAIDAYGVKDLEDLNTYLELQKNQLRNIISNFARPILQFLTADIMNDPNSKDKMLLNRWRRIVEQFDAYEKKQPGNSLSKLEDFILKELNSYDLKSCFNQIDLSDLNEKTGDYFLELIQNIKHKVLSKAEVLTRQQGIKNYAVLVKIFNNKLRNKFPFVSSDLTNNNGEADPDDIREFFQKFKEFGGSAKNILNQIYQLGEMSKDAVNFLRNMENIREFLAYYLDNKSDDDIPTFDLKINFRVNRPQEKGGKMVVDWFFKPDPDTVIDKQDKLTDGRWRFGDPVQVGFRWVKMESNDQTDDENVAAATKKIVKPVKDPNQVNLEISNETAIFKYGGRWSLLWLLRTQAAPRGSYSTIKDPNPYVLRFNIPTGENERAVLFNMITLIVPSTKPKTPGKVVRVPDFPVIAPDLASEVIELKEQPVLTEGIMESVDIDALSTTNRPSA